MEGISACYLAYIREGLPDSALCIFWTDSLAVISIAWSYCLCFGLMSFALLYQQFALDLFTLLYCCAVTTCLYEILAVYTVDQSGVKLGLILKLLWSALGMLSGLGLCFTRSFSLARLQHSTLNVDRPAYESAWGRVQSADGAQLAILRLSSLCAEIKAAAHLRRSGPCRQYYRRAAEEEPGRPAAGEAGRRVAVTSLSQLIDQASCLRILLEREVRAVLCAAGPPTDVPEAAPAPAPQVRSGVKPQGRALEKAAKCYFSDASRVVDCCRASVVFERLAELAGFLDAARRCNALEILRVKNLYDTDADTGDNAGFRSLAARAPAPASACGRSTGKPVRRPAVMLS